MILDSSVIVALVLKEPGIESLIEKIQKEPQIGISAVSVVESAIVLSARLSKDASFIVSELLRHIQAITIPFTESHWQIAVQGYNRFGKGKHKAALNFGDCISYATAKYADQSLLFCGEDFSQTDVKQA